MSLDPIPDRLVVLTFDDGNQSDITYVAPLLKRYGFSATFFITEGLGFNVDSERRLAWEAVAELDAGGFEIGNHTASHPNLVSLSKGRILSEVEGFERSCEIHGIPRPTTFAYPGGHHDRKSVEVLTEKGYRWARRCVDPEYPLIDDSGRGPVYDPSEAHPLLIPSTLMSGPNWKREDLAWAVESAKDGKIAVLTFHGVPDVYPHCSTEPAEFAAYMQYLDDQGCTVIAMRDLERYVDFTRRSENPYADIERRLGVTPVEPKCEYTVDPLGIDTAAPRFGWVLESTRRGQMQAAYQILVASSEAHLKQDRGDLWDSGKVVSTQSVHIAYKGRPLASGQKCWWKVRCWNRPGFDGIYATKTYHDSQILEAMRKEIPSSYSVPSTFEMGLLSESDWNAQWIAAFDKDISSPLFRRDFALDKEITRARVYVSGLGYYELHINGEKVGDHVLDPGTTYYNDDQPFELRARVLYVTYDVTGLLKTGQNTLGVMLGHGWYSAEADIPPSPSHRTPYGDRPVLILQMNIELADGECQCIVTDDTWKTAAGPIVYNDYNNGETYDARLETPGWDAPGYDDSNWRTPLAMEPPNGVLRAQMLPPIKVMKTIKPVGILKPDEDVHVYDFGQDFTGWAQLRVKGPRGTKVRLKYAVNVYDDNRLNTRSSAYNCPDSEEAYRQGIGRQGGVHHCARQTDIYILKGEGVEVWEPRFTLHGFRYVEVTGFPGEPMLENLEGRFVCSAVETSGEFSCSNALINQIHRNACWTFLSSLQSIPQDAADRSERVAWLGDPGFVAEDYIYNFDTASFWTKWLSDIEDSQKPDGDIPVVSPIHWRGTHSPYSLMPAWKSTYPLFVWHLYWHYGDERILETHYEGVEKLVEFLDSKAHNHIIPHGLGDHMEPQADGTSSSAPNHTPPSLTSTAYYYYDAWILSRSAEILGKTADARRYAALAKRIKDAFNAAFLDESTKQYATGSQTSNALPLYLGMVPAGMEKAVAKNLIDDIRITRNGHLSTGIIGTNALVQALPKCGAADVMYELVTQTTLPSWGYQICSGATTLWETWEGDSDHSFNMKMFGSTDKFFYKDLAGISPAAPGYRCIRMKPPIVGDLKRAFASIKTVGGPAVIDWERTDKLFKMKVVIPANTVAKVSIPRMGLTEITITESGQILWEAGEFVHGVSGITAGDETPDDVTFDVGSGSYVFQLTG